MRFRFQPPSPTQALSTARLAAHSGLVTFASLSESTGVIRELGHQIWLQTLSALVAWRDQGYNVRVAINVSKRQLFSGRFAEQLVGELAANGLSPTDVTIEVTESVALLDVAHASEHLEDLHKIVFTSPLTTLAPVTRHCRNCMNAGG
jgi:EAL domain-containing protein (putative c-di-GMP-specific phosphodiesterase class I)